MPEEIDAAARFAALDAMRRELRRIWPPDCCEKQPMLAGGVTTMLCAETCRWSAFELALANVSVEAELAAEVHSDP